MQNMTNIKLLVYMFDSFYSMFEIMIQTRKGIIKKKKSYDFQTPVTRKHKCLAFSPTIQKFRL